MFIVSTIYYISGEIIMATDEGNEGQMLDSESKALMSIVRDHKVFWTTLPIELAGNEGRPLRVGMAVALVGTDGEEKTGGVPTEEPTAFDKLYELARWLTSGDEPGVRFEIRRLDNVVFYLPDDLRTNRKEYVVVIRVLHSDEFDLPLDENQLQTVKKIETRLKGLGCPKDRWKEHPAAI